MREHRLALIPPLSLVSRYQGPINGTYMFLPQLFGNPEYDAFAERVAGPDSFVIMDNGAYEAADDFTCPQLFELCLQHGVDELVIPDVLGDKEGTLGKLFHFAGSTVRLRHRRKMRYMLVAQGTTIAECLSCVTEALEMTNFITTVGLPKHLVKTVNENARVVLAGRIAARFPYLSVHFLGSAPSWPDEIAHTKNVRSMDTSMPFSFAWHGQRMLNAPADGYYERPANYFNLPAEGFSAELIQTNINQMVEWMNA
jgi:hypothetical protein